MQKSDAIKFSLADFLYSESDDPLLPSDDFVEWSRNGVWATSLYLQSLLKGPSPRTEILVDGVPKPVINLTSYNYLGLARHPETVAAAKTALDDRGTGSCGSPILSGMTDLHRELENELSKFLGRPATMLFNSGFAGAFGIMTGLLRRGDAVVVDEKSHICWIEGARAAGARIETFAHNSAESLDQALAKHTGKRRVVIIEGIYSMDGDMADLPALVPVAQRHGVGIIIDEAHSILTAGPNGRGVTEHFGIEDGITLKYGTFSKAFAGVGGFVSGPAETLNYLRYYASSYSFSCSLPPATIAALIAALNVAKNEPERRRQLERNTTYFREKLNAMGIDTGESTTQVVPLIIGSNRLQLYEMGNELRDRGLFMAPVDYPSVPEDALRFRASVMCGHDRSTLDEALGIIEDVISPKLRNSPLAFHE